MELGWSSIFATFLVERVHPHTHRPERAVEHDAFADLGRLPADAIETLLPDYLRVALRVSKVAQIRDRNFSGVYPYFFTPVVGIWRGFEEAGIAPISDRVGEGLHFGISPYIR